MKSNHSDRLTGLMLGAAVDSCRHWTGAIHRVAGPVLVAECAMLHGCKTGAAKITKGYQLPAKWVIHTVGPVWNGGVKIEPELLVSSYLNCLNLCREHGIKSVALPLKYQTPHLARG